MHAVIVHVKIVPTREEEARKLLADVVVPQAKQMPGFKSGTWFRALEGEGGIACLLFESEAAARDVVERMRSEAAAGDPPATPEAIEAFEVVAQA